jgi:hypothetical protein
MACKKRLTVSVHNWQPQLVVNHNHELQHSACHQFLSQFLDQLCNNTSSMTGVQYTKSTKVWCSAKNQTVSATTSANPYIHSFTIRKALNDSENTDVKIVQQQT